MIPCILLCYIRLDDTPLHQPPTLSGTVIFVNIKLSKRTHCFEIQLFLATYTLHTSLGPDWTCFKSKLTFCTDHVIACIISSDISKMTKKNGNIPRIPIENFRNKMDGCRYYCFMTCNFRHLNILHFQF